MHPQDSHGKLHPLNPPNSHTTTFHHLTSSRLTTTAALAAGAYWYTSASPESAVPDKINHTKHSDLEAPKPVEDRHGDTVAKHSMAAHKNQNKVREGVFQGGEFDNHLQKHSPDPSRDFEKK